MSNEVRVATILLASFLAPGQEASSTEVTQNLSVSKTPTALNIRMQNQQIAFHIRGSVHSNFRLKKSNEMQQYADIYLLLNYSKCFGASILPIIRST